MNPAMKHGQNFFCPHHPEEFIQFTQKSSRAIGLSIFCFKCVEDNSEDFITFNSLFKETEVLYDRVRETESVQSNKAQEIYQVYQQKQQLRQQFDSENQKDVANIDQACDKLQEEMTKLINTLRKDLKEGLAVQSREIEIDFSQLYTKHQRYCATEPDAGSIPKFKAFLETSQQHDDIMDFNDYIFQVKRVKEEFISILETHDKAQAKENILKSQVDHIMRAVQHTPWQSNPSYEFPSMLIQTLRGELADHIATAARKELRLSGGLKSKGEPKKDLFQKPQLQKPQAPKENSSGHQQQSTSFFGNSKPKSEEPIKPALSFGASSQNNNPPKEAQQNLATHSEEPKKGFFGNVTNAGASLFNKTTNASTAGSQPAQKTTSSEKSPKNDSKEHNDSGLFGLPKKEEQAPSSGIFSKNQSGGSEKQDPLASIPKSVFQSSKENAPTMPSGGIFGSSAQNAEANKEQEPIKLAQAEPSANQEQKGSGFFSSGGLFTKASNPPSLEGKEKKADGLFGTGSAPAKDVGLFGTSSAPVKDGGLFGGGKGQDSNTSSKGLFSGLKPDSAQKSMDIFSGSGGLASNKQEGGNALFGNKGNTSVPTAGTNNSNNQGETITIFANTSSAEGEGKGNYPIVTDLSSQLKFNPLRPDPKVAPSDEEKAKIGSL